MLHKNDTVIVKSKTENICNKYLNMHFGWFKNRLWQLKFSFAKRYCYVTGENLQFKLAYRGRRQITNIVCPSQIINDDIWISQSQYLIFLKNTSV